MRSPQAGVEAAPRYFVGSGFGVQEYSPFCEQTRVTFIGCPEVKYGYLYVNERPGWSIELDEQAAKKLPIAVGRGNLNGGWSDLRLPNGTVIKQ